LGARPRRHVRTLRRERCRLDPRRAPGRVTTPR
jgi:hypothetical protein